MKKSALFCKIFFDKQLTKEYTNMTIAHFPIEKEQKNTQHLSDSEKKNRKMEKDVNKQKKKKREKRKRERAKQKKANKAKKQNERRVIKDQRKLEKNKKGIENLTSTIAGWLDPKQVTVIAKLIGYIKRVDLKILPLPFILTLAISMYNQGDCSYTMIAANMSSWFNISITPQALSERMSKKETVLFLKNILKEAMIKQIAVGCKNKYAMLLNCFTSVKIEDSTQFNLHEKVKKLKGSGGSASTSSMKLNTVYDITKHTISDLDIVPGAVSDQTLAKNVKKTIEKGELRIRDLGYFEISCMYIIDVMKAFFLSRLKKGVNIFIKKEDEDPQDIEAFLQENTANGDAFDKDVYIGEKKSRLKVRIIGEKVPESVKQQRIERYKKNVIKRDKKKKMKKDYVVWCGYSIFITNIPREMLACPSIIMCVYKIRWQIELFFKRIKSLLQIHIIKGETENRVYCLIYTKLIAVLMSQAMISYAASICEADEEVSEHKLMEWLQTNNRLGNAIIYGKMEECLEELILFFSQLCKNKRKTRKSTLMQMEEVFDAYMRTAEEVEKIA
jgi:hypothetical protein